jgi:hypothetical protein
LRLATVATQGDFPQLGHSCRFLIAPASKELTPSVDETWRAEDYKQFWGALADAVPPAEGVQRRVAVLPMRSHTYICRWGQGSLPGALNLEAASRDRAHLMSWALAGSSVSDIVKDPGGDVYVLPLDPERMCEVPDEAQLFSREHELRTRMEVFLQLRGFNKGREVERYNGMLLGIEPKDGDAPSTHGDLVCFGEEEDEEVSGYRVVEKYGGKEAPPGKMCLSLQGTLGYIYDMMRAEGLTVEEAEQYGAKEVELPFRVDIVGGLVIEDFALMQVHRAVGHAGPAQVLAEVLKLTGKIGLRTWERCRAIQ